MVSAWFDCSVFCSKECTLVKEKKMLRVVFNKFTIGAAALIYAVLQLLTRLEGNGVGPFATLWWKFTMWMASHGF